MAVLSVKEQLLQEIEYMSQDEQSQVLEFALQLKQIKLPQGTPGEVLLARMGTFKFAPGQLEEIERALEEDSERVELKFANGFLAL